MDDKKWYESKAVWLGLATIALSIVTFLSGEEWVQKYPNAVAILGTAIGVLTIIVRYLTDRPMFRRSKAKTPQ